MKSLIDRLTNDKIKFNWNKNPIKMDLFLSFILVDIESNSECLGYGNGWREYVNSDISLKIKGGLVHGYGVLLDSIQFGKNLQNKYNNFVNPFYLWDIMNNEGRKFFLEYYKEDIKKVLKDESDTLKYFRSKVKEQNDLIQEYKQQLQQLTSI